MNEITDFLSASSIQYLATIGTDGRPKVRPFQFMFEEEGKMYFCTSNTKEVYKELSLQPWVELCAIGENNSWIRISGKVVFTQSREVKIRILEISPLVKSIYQSADNPALEAFYLSEVTAIVSSLSNKILTR